MTGPIKKKVRTLLGHLRRREISEDGFVEGLNNIIREHGARLQNIGLTIQAQARDDQEREHLFRLADRADPRIREKKDGWIKKMR